MAPQKHKKPKCQVCSTNESKYTCSGCLIVYCSVPCYKQHKASDCGAQPVAGPSKVAPTLTDEPMQTDADGTIDPNVEPPLEDPTPLRPLTSLNWPYVLEESAYPDPLKRDDPKTLQPHQYEAIATSPSIRKALASHANLIPLLTSIDSLRGPDREHALQRALGVAVPDITNRAGPGELSDDVLALRELAEAVEAVVRGENRAALGLDWGMGEE